MKLQRLFLSLLASFGLHSMAFIPPLGIGIREATRFRFFSGPEEIRVRHRQGNVEFDERILHEGNTVLILWQGQGAIAPSFPLTAVQWEKQGYTGTGFRFDSKSEVAMRYLV